jgi:starch phosphorylase
MTGEDVLRQPLRAGAGGPAGAQERYLRIAHDFRWSWHIDAERMFRALDAEEWEASGENPLRLLEVLTPAGLERALREAPDLAELFDRVDRDFESYRRERDTWFVRRFKGRSLRVGYFSAEFAIADCLPIFAGGLGAIASEHVKSASALGVPVVGVGLLYQETSRQWLDASARQQESWERLDVASIPVVPVTSGDGRPVEVTVPFPGREVRVRCFRARVGRSTVLLLDTDVTGNRDDDRAITQRLYPSEHDVRIRQELVLGIGGHRMLEALGLHADVIHLNEGHTGFSALERVASIMRSSGLTFEEARLASAPGIVFTTHTPVAAGHDYFAPDLARRHLEPVADGLGVAVEDLMRLGRHDPSDQGDTLCPTVLALRLAGNRNGVSKLHGVVSRGMWRGLWPRVPLPEVPIGHVTNGVHLQTWISPEMNALFIDAIGPDWRRHPGDEATWKGVADVPDEQLWDARCRQRARLVDYARRRLRLQLERRGARPEQVAAQDERLDPDALTIGFVGRFVAYKRPTLFLRDKRRLAALLRDDDRPVQLVFAGKAHPKDTHGKELLREVVAFARREGLTKRIVFLEDFDVSMDRSLVQGVDVWLNTPRRPDEACGIAGMKSGANGALNLSTLDGWWDQAWRTADPGAPPIGWVIGGESYPDLAIQDAEDAASLYERLEEAIVPTFYERDAAGVPRRWVASMKSSIVQLAATWDSHRMVEEYTRRFYVPGASRSERLAEADGAPTRDLAAYLARVRAGWTDVEVGEVSLVGRARRMAVARAAVRLGGLAPDDVTVQLWVDRDGRADAVAEALEPVGRVRAGAHRFELVLPRDRVEGAVLAARVLPVHPALDDPFSAGLIAWSG